MNDYWLQFGHTAAAYPDAMNWAFELMVWEALWAQEDAR